MTLETVVVGPFEVNCHVVWGDDRRAFVIDPGDNAADIARVIAEHGLLVRAYLLTHGHCDHVSAAAELAGQFPAPVTIHPADGAWAFSSRNVFLPFYPAPKTPPDLEILQPDGREDKRGFAVIFTPGHSPGSVCYHFPQARLLFSGDTLFRDSVGRTDLPGGNSRLLADSLKVLSALPDDTRVLTGHGPETTIGREKSESFFFRGTAW
jgi:glyoxylase-like metal-dependent hydrolase (beta-lactamase superfamily II)